MSGYYVVTGDRGFVGQHLRAHLLDQGGQVVGISRSAGEQQHSGYQALQLDLANREAVWKAADVLQGAKGVFHLAAKLPTGDDQLQAHLDGTLRSTENLLSVLDGCDVPLVLSSTMSVYGLPPIEMPVSEEQPARPDEPYGLTKLAAECTAERLARSGRVPTVVLRYPGIFGLGYEYGAIHFFLTEDLADQVVSVYGSGKIVRDYVHVEDVVAANLLAMQSVRGLGWDLFHIGGGNPLSLVDVAKLVVAKLGYGEVDTNDRPGPFDFAFDISRAQEILGYAPMPLGERIGQYVEEFTSANEAHAS